MKQSILTTVLCRVCVVCAFLVLIPGEMRAGQEPTDGGNAPVTRQIQGKEPFQPVLKGPTQEDLNIKTAEYLFLHGRIYEVEKKERQALQCYERACQYVSSDAILICLVQLAIQQKRYDEAICYFDKIQNPSALGIEALDSIASVCARLQDGPRVAKTYRAILNAIPMTESGPLRMLVHERLAFAEYSEENYEAALVSANVVHTMLKSPARYGIGVEEGAELFGTDREPLLLILLDSNIIQKNTAEAKAILEELQIFKEEEISNPELPEKQREELKEEWEKQFLFDSARITLLDSRPEEAMKFVQDAYSRGFYEDETPYSMLDQILEVQNRTEERLKFLEDLQKKQPENDVLKAELAEEYRLKFFKEKDPTDAEHAEKLYIELGKKYPVVYFRLAQMKIIQNNPKAFLTYTESFLKNLQLSEPRESLMELFQQADPDVKSPELNEEISENKTGKTEQSTTEQPKVEQSPAEQSEVEQSETERYSETYKVFQDELLAFTAKRLEEKPDLKMNWLRAWFLGVLAQEQNQQLSLRLYEISLKSLQELFQAQKIKKEKFPLVETFFMDWGSCLGRWELFEQGEKHFLTAMEFFPESSVYKRAYTQMLMAQGKLEEAGKQIQKMKEATPQDLELAVLESLYFLQCGKLDEACAKMRVLIGELQDDYSAELNRKAVMTLRLHLSNLEDQLGNYKEAEESLRQCLDEFPDEVEAKNTIAYFWACRNSNLEQALKYSEETLKEAPDEATYQDTLGWIYYRLGEFDEARKLLLEAAESMKDPVVFSHLADVSLALNQKEEAIQYFNQSQELFQESKRKHQPVNSSDEEHVKTQLNSLQK